MVLTASNLSAPADAATKCLKNFKKQVAPTGMAIMVIGTASAFVQVCCFRCRRSPVSELARAGPAIWYKRRQHLFATAPSFQQAVQGDTKKGHGLKDFGRRRFTVVQANWQFSFHLLI